MNASITDYQVPDGTHDLYDVYLFNDRIQTLVTDTPALVESWISDIESFHSRRLHRLIVGLDVEWRPNYGRHRDNPVATLQLCVGRRCLIFQLIYAPFIPSSLVEFLDNPMYTFVGVGIDSDAVKLENDYGLWVGTTVELGPLAAQEYGISALRSAGLKELARQVLGKEIEKPRDIAMSRWDNERLYPAQVLYACIDAFISFEIGRCLDAAGN
ncbi:exodeoxyribonuclease I [Sarracenia purpurea var. burkii]